MDNSTHQKIDEKNAASKPLHVMSSCLFYIIFSSAMVIANKSIDLTISGGYGTMPHFSIVMFQNVIAIAMCLMRRIFCCIDFPICNKSTASTWIPLNMLFVATLCTYSVSQTYIAIPSIQQFKSVSILLIVYGSSYSNRKKDLYTVLAASIISAGALIIGMGEYEYMYILFYM